MEDQEFKEELKQVFSTMGQLLGYQENKVANVYLVQVRGNHTALLIGKGFSLLLEGLRVDK